MLQPTVWTQLARINNKRILGGVRTMIEINYQPPLSVVMHEVSKTIGQLKPSAKHFYMGGTRCFGISVKLILEGKVIALPTDTVYGLATLAQHKNAIDKLYKIKGRDANKPVAICVSGLKDIKKWGEIDHISPFLIESLLPGPVTIVVKRKPALNPKLNPGIDTVGIRVPCGKFLRGLCKVVDQPLALTSANSSGEKSSMHPDEFSHLWPELGGIFYTNSSQKSIDDSIRVGSTIVDLTEPNQYKIIRQGIGYSNTIKLLHRHGLKQKEE